MEIILLEKITNLGDPGDLVNVKGGYARNFLIPSGKAIRADKDNKAEFEKKKESLLVAEEARKNSALEISKILEGSKFSISVAVSEEGTMYGSIGTREISEAISNSHAIEVEKSSVRLPEGALKELGVYEVDLELHPEVIQKVSVEISPEE
ncbi:MAG: 50S ribosomal protein L9 [Gammaproteobacteria bacterium]